MAFTMLFKVVKAILKGTQKLKFGHLSAEMIIYYHLEHHVVQKGCPMQPL
jgi:hypothetical protein